MSNLRAAGTAAARPGRRRRGLPAGQLAVAASLSPTTAVTGTPRTAACVGPTAGPRRTMRPAAAAARAGTSASVWPSSSGRAPTRASCRPPWTSSSGRAAPWCAASSLPVSDPITLHPVSELGVPVWLEVSEPAPGRRPGRRRRGGRATPSCAPAGWRRRRTVRAGARRLHRRGGRPLAALQADRRAAPRRARASTAASGCSTSTAWPTCSPRPPLATSGGTPTQVRDVLDVREPDVLRRALAALDDEDVDRLRASFASFGCCGVTDPLRRPTDGLSDLLDPTDRLETT